MPFPIYYQGKILFRDGKPAFSLDCCCGDDPRCPSYCICGCRWAVDDDFCQIANEDDGFDPATPFGNWLPGPVQVTGLKFTTTSNNPNRWDFDFFACGENLDTVEFEQSGPSRYYCKASVDVERCCAVPDFLWIPVDEKIGSCAFPGSLIITPNRSKGCDPPLRILPHSALTWAWEDDIEFAINGCSSVSASGATVSPEVFNWSIEAEISNLSACSEEDEFPDDVTPTY